MKIRAMSVVIGSLFVFAACTGERTERKASQQAGNYEVDFDKSVWGNNGVMIGVRLPGEGAPRPDQESQETRSEDGAQ